MVLLGGQVGVEGWGMAVGLVGQAYINHPGVLSLSS